MRVEHPADVPPAAVDVDGDTRPVDADGTFEADAGWLQAFAQRHGVDPDEILLEDEPPPDDVAETCDTVKADGDVCGRELPCPYHSESED